MGYRNGFNAARIVSAYNSYQNRIERERLIKNNSTIDNTPQYEYEIVSFDFDASTRNTTIVFQETKQYRTIERYVTQNYERYPVYSGIKTKAKNINKSIKLTNTVLENLNTNEDELIRAFCEDIIVRLHCEELIPSWFTINKINEEKNQRIKSIEKQKNDSINDYENEIEKIISISDDYQLEISRLINEKIDQTNKLKRTNNKIQFINKYKSSIIIYIITLSIAFFFLSSSRLSRLECKAKLLTDNIESISLRIEKLNETIISNSSKIDIIKKQIEEANQQYNKSKKQIDNNFEYRINQVTKLKESYDEVSFIPLKSLAGFERKKITGCYVIRNTENSKVYVGQSKDVLRRLNQHFKGTVPKNIIFAEDYYNSKLDNKVDLFEFRIIELETKDELDDTERWLIDYYDAYISGYNGTKGNK